MNYYPYRHIPSLIKSQQSPSKPAIVSRSASSITVKLPFFKPRILDKFNIKVVHSLALYGKEAGTGTKVSLTNHEFPGLA